MGEKASWISKLPLNQKTTIVAQKFIIAIAEKISNDEVIISYINLENHEEVLRLHQRIETGSQLLSYLEPGYWNISMQMENTLLISIYPCFTIWKLS